MKADIKHRGGNTNPNLEWSDSSDLGSDCSSASSLSSISSSSGSSNVSCSSADSDSD